MPKRKNRNQKPKPSVTSPSQKDLADAPIAINGVTTAPTNGVTTASTNGVTTASTNGVTTASTNGVTTPSTNGVTTASTNGVTTAPTSKPTNGVATTSTSKPTHPAPISTNGVTSPTPISTNGVVTTPTSKSTTNGLVSHTPIPTKQIDFDEITDILGSMVAHQEPTKLKYTYPSAGSLYSLQTYLLITTPIEGLPPGVYYLHPVESELVSLLDQSPFREATEGVFIVVACKKGVIEVAYGQDLAEPFAFLEAGAMRAVLEEVAARHDVQLVEVNGDLLEKYDWLDEIQICDIFRLQKIK